MFFSNLITNSKTKIRKANMMASGFWRVFKMFSSLILYASDNWKEIIIAVVDSEFFFVTFVNPFLLFLFLLLRKYYFFIIFGS